MHAIITDARALLTTAEWAGPRCSPPRPCSARGARLHAQALPAPTSPHAQSSDTRSSTAVLSPAQQPTQGWPPRLPWRQPSSSGRALVTAHTCIGTHKHTRHTAQSADTCTPGGAAAAALFASSRPAARVQTQPPFALAHTHNAPGQRIRACVVKQRRSPTAAGMQALEASSCAPSSRSAAVASIP